VIGEVLGHCRVLAKIGEGGMGLLSAYDECAPRYRLKCRQEGRRLDPSASRGCSMGACFFFSLSSTLHHP